MDSGGGWDVRKHVVALALGLGLLCSRLAAAGGASPISLSGTATGGSLTGDWIDDDGLVDSGGTVALGADYALGFGKLQVANPGQQNNRPKLSLTATKVALAGEQTTLRSVTVRARRGTDTVCGKVRVYRDRDDNEVIEFALYKQGETPVFEEVAEAIDGAAALVLVWENGDASLTFGATEYPTQLGGLATVAVDLCRVELQGNPYLGPIPSIESLDAVYSEN